MSSCYDHRGSRRSREKPGPLTIIIRPRAKNGLFSVPAPPLCSAERRGFFVSHQLTRHAVEKTRAFHRFVATCGHFGSELAADLHYDVARLPCLRIGSLSPRDVVRGAGTVVARTPRVVNDRRVSQTTYCHSGYPQEGSHDSAPRWMRESPGGSPCRAHAVLLCAFSQG